MLNHHFGAGAFKTELWIAGKKVFPQPRGVDVEFVTAGSFDWIFADAAGKEIRVVSHQNPNGGWTSIDLSSLGVYGDCSIGFRNTSGGEKKIKQGNIRLA